MPGQPGHSRRTLERGDYWKMSNNNAMTYEGMFLLPSITGDFETAAQPVRNILERYGAEILTFKPWDDRKLAYEIAGHRRGLYVLCYFRLNTDKVREVEHDCHLDEQVLRVLILRKDRLTEEVINAPTPAMSGNRADDSKESTDQAVTVDEPHEEKPQEANLENDESTELDEQLPTV